MSTVLDWLRKFTDALADFRHLVVISSVVFFFIIGVAFFLVYQNARVMRDQINSDFNQQQLILAQQAASQIDANVQDIEVELTSLRGCLETESPESCDRAMEGALERTRPKGLVEIGWADAEGRIRKTHLAEGVPPMEPGRIRESCRWDGSGRMVLGPLTVENPETKDLRITGLLCSKVGRPDGGEGVLFGRLDAAQLVARSTQEIRSGRTGYAWVIDEKGMFLFHPERDFVGRNAFTVRKERKPYISFVEINRIMKEQMLRGEQGTGVYVSGWHRGIEHQVTKLIAFTPVRGEAVSAAHTWSVAVVAPISEVAEAVHGVYLRHFAAEAALIIGMFVFGLVALLYQQRISRALKERVKQTEADLHERERIYQRVVEQATDLIYILDLDMRVVLLNRHSVETFLHLVVREPEGGVPADLDMTNPENWIGRRLDDLFPAQDASFMRRQIDRLLEQRSNLFYEHTISVKGRKVHLSTKLIPIRDESGTIYQVLGISRDVTEKMEMDQRIYNTEKLASIGTLAAGVAHEINNPLAIILGFADLLLERFPEGSPEHEDLKMIEYNGKHAKKIVENLLAFARITEGLEDTVDIKRSVQTVMNIVRNTLMTKKIELVLDLPDGLPRVRGDDREFQQVIFNLVNNSVAAMQKGGGRLILSARQEGEWVHVSVTDDGVGIPDRIKPQIFDPFFTTKKVGEGTGLGLSLCYGIVKKYGGRISFVSTSAEDHPDKPSGTTFTVSMPVWHGEEASEGANP
jgi:two-component system NtrC family sensor kinase